MYIDIFEAVLAEGARLGIDVRANYSFVSGGALARSASAWTAIADDVGFGLLDVGVGDIWPIPERMRLSPFTITVSQSTFFLLVPRPSSNGGSDGSTFESFKRSFEPFGTDLWMAILGASLVVGCLQSYVRIRLEAPEDELEESSRQRSKPETREARLVRYRDYMWTGLIEALGELMSGGVGVDVTAVLSPGGRLLYLGTVSTAALLSRNHSRADHIIAS